MTGLRLVACAIFCASFAIAADQRVLTFSAEVSDSQCAFDVHSNTGSHEELMKTGLYGHTAAECVRACVRSGGKVVLIDKVKKKVYHVANPSRVEEFAGRQVRVRGTVDQKGILTVLEIEPQ